ncbi:MAG TPA: zinc-binding dehydrogenase [Thermoflexales bacterium]|nr:zinc-binding dehydrogenase [Thermoflexales bacterium]HQW36561.1 zinc-binding dehydrogenase [Thermoflexales bacterium]HQZ99002.1 zinc-binding dehydrogenase [Thermoflexales bacterium]
MQEFVVSAPRTIEYRAHEMPPLKPNEVRVRTLLSGIKQGTDLNVYRGTTPFLTQDFDLEWRMFLPRADAQPFYPIALGSWGVGQVMEVGRDVTRVQVGQRVHGSMLHKPTNARAESDVFPLADGVAPEAMLFTDPALFALCAAHDAQIKTGDCVAVFGMGALGLIAIQIARLQGAEKVFAVDTIPMRMALAKEFGADAVFDARADDVPLELRKLTGKKGVDSAIEFSGAYAGLNAAIKSVRQGGIVAAAGYYKTGQTGLELGAEWHHNRPTLVSSMPAWGNSLRAHPMWDLQRLRETAARLIEHGKLNVLPMITHRFAYADAPQAYELLDKRADEAVKVILEYDGGRKTRDD